MKRDERLDAVARDVLELVQSTASVRASPYAPTQVLARALLVVIDEIHAAAMTRAVMETPIPSDILYGARTMITGTEVVEDKP